jgi:predicted nucleotidyltransferase
MNSTLATYKDQIVPLLKRYNVRKAAFFGSLVDGRFTQMSDVDMLVLPPPTMSLLDFVGLKQDIEDRIGKDVDLVSYNGLSPYLKDSILSEQRVFYEANQ